MHPHFFSVKNDKMYRVFNGRRALLITLLKYLKLGNLERKIGLILQSLSSKIDFYIKKSPKNSTFSQ